MNKLADHVSDRATERTGLHPKEVADLRKKLRGIDLEPGVTYYFEWPQRGFAVIAPAREGYSKHVVKTILAPWMSPPGVPLPMQKVATIDPAILGFFSQELQKVADARTHLIGSAIGAGIGAGGTYKSQSDERRQDRLLKDIGQMDAATAHRRKIERRGRVLAGTGIGAGLGMVAPLVGAKAKRVAHEAISDLGRHAERVAQPTIQRVADEGRNLVRHARAEAHSLAKEQGRATVDEFARRGPQIVGDMAEEAGARATTGVGKTLRSWIPKRPTWLGGRRTP